MKKIIILSLAILFALQLQNCSYLAPGSNNQDWKTQEYEEEAEFKFLRDKYDTTFDASFETVWNASIKSIEDINCMITSKNPEQDEETGLYRGIIKSDYCIFAQGDTTKKVLEYYSIEVPFIRGGIWVNGRMNYIFNISEKENGSTYVEIEGGISGFERHVTSKVQFWESNGYFETMMLKRLGKNVANM